MCHTVSTVAETKPTSVRSKRRQTRERTRRQIVDAAAELVRERSYAELNVGEIMERAGIGRTLFYRHFDDLGDLLLDVAEEALDELYETQVRLAEARLAEPDRQVPDPAVMMEAIEVTVDVYSRHGPLLRAVIDAAAGDPVVAADSRRCASASTSSSPSCSSAPPSSSAIRRLTLPSRRGR